MQIKAKGVSRWLAAGAFCLGGIASQSVLAKAVSHEMGHMAGQHRYGAASVPQPADGRHLFALNTPDNRLEIFKVNGHKKDRLHLKPRYFHVLTGDHFGVDSHQRRVVRTIQSGERSHDHAKYSRSG